MDPIIVTRIIKVKLNSLDGERLNLEPLEFSFKSMNPIHLWINFIPTYSQTLGFARLHVIAVFGSKRMSLIYLDRETLILRASHLQLQVVHDPLWGKNNIWSVYLKIKKYIVVHYTFLCILFSKLRRRLSFLVYVICCKLLHIHTRTHRAQRFIFL